MKLVTIDRGTDGHPGVLVGEDAILDLVALRRVLPLAVLVPETIRAVLEAGPAGLETVRRCLDAVSSMSGSRLDALRGDGVLCAMADLPLLAPIPNPKLVLSAAANYGKHVKEFSSVSAPKYPTAFIKTADSLTGHLKPIIVPPWFPDRVDFEGEMCFVFGRECHNVDEASAIDYVAGYTVCNDVSARDWVPEVFASQDRWDAIRSWERNVMGKNLPTFTPCGPFLTTADEIEDPHALKITTTLNGNVMQSGSTSELLYNLPQMISYFSRWYRFSPGDVVTTGTPEGVGVGRKPQVFMKDGDRIEVGIEKLGKLSNRVVSGAGR